MLSVVIPTLNEAEALAATLAALVPAAAEGVVREVVVVDAGSTDGTLALADDTGCAILSQTGPIGARLARGAGSATRGEWLLFLKPGVVFDSRWADDAQRFADRATRAGRQSEIAALYPVAPDDPGARQKLGTRGPGAVGRFTRTPHPAQPLLLARTLYARIGGHRPLAALEDLDIIARIGRGNVVTLAATAALSGGAAAPQDGRHRLVRGAASLGLPVDLLARWHG